MAKIGLGIGKRPQVNIPLSIIELDNNNPRLADEYKGSSELTILRVLYEEFDLEDIGFSMVENGYFEEEPIVVVSKGFPKSFKWDEKDIEKTQKEIEKLISSGKDIKFIVVEGNRRIATAKLLVDNEIRKKIKIEEDDFPTPKNKKIEDDLRVIPAIIYKDRNEVSPYLGVTHISRKLRWEAYAKAIYIAKRIEDEKRKGKSIEKSINYVKQNIGDRSDTIIKQYMSYKIFKQVEKELDFDTHPIKLRFSLIWELLSKPPIRDFIGVSSYKEAKLDKDLVSPRKLGNLKNLLTWVFGNGKDKPPIVTDSRLIGKKLAPILANSHSTENLLKFESLEGAYEKSGGDKEFLKKRIDIAINYINAALSVAYKYKNNPEMIIKVNELKKAFDELYNTISTKK